MRTDRKAPQAWAITGGLASRALSSCAGSPRQFDFRIDDFQTLDAPTFIPAGSTVPGTDPVLQVGNVTRRESLA